MMNYQTFSGFWSGSRVSSFGSGSHISSFGPFSLLGLRIPSSNLSLQSIVFHKWNFMWLCLKEFEARVWNKGNSTTHWSSFSNRLDLQHIYFRSTIINLSLFHHSSWVVLVRLKFNNSHFALVLLLDNPVVISWASLNLVRNLQSNRVQSSIFIILGSPKTHYLCQSP